MKRKRSGWVVALVDVLLEKEELDAVEVAAILGKRPT
jgi:hypothetical protein